MKLVHLTSKLWFFIIIISPGVLQIEKSIILSLIIFFGLACRLYTPIYLNRDFIAYCIFLVGLYCIAILGWLHGFMNGNPGAWPNFNLYFIYPLIWILFFFINGLPNTLSMIRSSAIWGGLLLSGLVFVAIGMESYGLDPSQYLVFNLMGIRTGEQFEQVKLSGRFLPFLIFAFAFLLEVALNKKQLNMSNQLIAGKTAFFFAILILSALLFSGRSVAFLCFVWFVFRMLSSYRLSWNYLFYFFISLTLFFFIDFDQIFRVLQIKLALTDEFSEVGSRRVGQLMQGIDTVTRYPLFGQGVGYSFDGTNEGWRIEITPITLLVSHGLIGFGILVYGLLLVLYRLSSKQFRQFSVSTLSWPVVLSAIASATNPILLKFDFLWIIILPFCLYGMSIYAKSSSSKATYRASKL